MPCWRFVLIASSTTIELSTSRPIPSVMPPRDMMFSDTPETNIRKKVPTTEIGIEMPMISVERSSPRNRTRIRTASSPPSIAVWSTSETDCRM